MIYHIVPKNMQGNILYPLAELQNRYPEIYTEQIAKYEDHPTRSNIPNCYIPKLNCKRRDVLIFSPIHPHLIYKALIKRGFDPPSLKFYVLSSKQPAAIEDTTRSAPDEPTPDEAIQLVHHIEELSELPKASQRWLDKLSDEKKIYGLFVGIPHVLIKNSVNIVNIPIIDWRDMPKSHNNPL